MKSLKQRQKKWSPSHRSRYAKLHAKGKKASKPPKDPYAKQVDAATKLQFGPDEAQFASERRISDLNTQRIPGWFQIYQDKVAGANQASSGAYDTARANLDAQRANSQSQDTATLDKMRALENEDAAKRGAAPAVAPQSDALQAQVARGAGQDVYGGLLNTLQANQTAYGQNRLAVAAQAGTEALGNEGKKRSKLESDARDLAAKKGAFKTKTRSDLVQQDFTNQAAAKTLGVKIDTANAQAQHLSTADKLAENKYKLDYRQAQDDAARNKVKDDFFAAHGYYPGTGKPAAGKGGKGGAGYKPTEGQLKKADTVANRLDAQAQLTQPKWWYSKGSLSPEVRRKRQRDAVANLVKAGYGRATANKALNRHLGRPANAPPWVPH